MVDVGSLVRSNEIGYFPLAETKMNDLNATSLEGAMKMESTARSLGVKISSQQ